MSTARISASATITLTDPQAGDLLAVDRRAAARHHGFQPEHRILTLSGVASLADYETALEAIRFSLAGDAPVAGTHVIDVVINDGTSDSPAAISLVTVVAVSLAPALVVADATYTENDPALALSPLASVTDPGEYRTERRRRPHHRWLVCR